MSPEGAAEGVARQARLLAWGVDSVGPALLCALCSALAAASEKSTDQVMLTKAGHHYLFVTCC